MDEHEQRARELGQQVLDPSAAGWPGTWLTGLAEKGDAPARLYVLGTLPAAGAHTVAIVGTRRATAYGLDLARAMASKLARRGIWVVSGLALGIDTAAHEGALDAPEGRTLAVLGTGVDVRYPAANATLRERIPTAGGLVSELDPGHPPARYTFPRRNRLIAAFADVVVVIEAPVRSGAMITARIASELGRTLLAVPGHVRRPNQAGCHRLLKQDDARLCEGAEDVLEALGLGDAGRRAQAALTQPSGPEAAVLDQLDVELASGLDAIALGSGLSPAAVTLALTRLELDGRVKRIPGVGYLRS